jgi:hypothetical protein
LGAVEGHVKTALAIGAVAVVAYVVYRYLVAPSPGVSAKIIAKVANTSAATATFNTGGK